MNLIKDTVGSYTLTTEMWSDGNYYISTEDNQELDMQELFDELCRLEKQLAIETTKKLDSFKREEYLENRCLELRRKTFARFNNEECWIFQDDGEDYVDSIICPVVISADKLRELLSLRDN